MTRTALARVLSRQVDEHPGRGIEWHARQASVTQGAVASALTIARSVRLVPPDMEHCRLCGRGGWDVCRRCWSAGGGDLPCVEGM